MNADTRTISTVLVPKLRQRFTDRGLQLGVPPSPCAKFPPIHPEFGEIQIYDDGDEATVVTGNFTHGHFSNYDKSLSAEQKAEDIADQVVTFLEDVFADEVAFWGGHDRHGGWCYVDHLEESGLPHKNGEKLYVWSGPMS